MNQNFLNLIPKRYLCPFCGEWHNWELAHNLGYYDSSSRIATLGCENQLPNRHHREMQIYFSDGYCYYRTIPTCARGNLDINNKILIEDIVENSEEHSVKFAVPFTADYEVGGNDCSKCDSENRCLMCKLSDNGKSRHMHITFGFVFKQSDYEFVDLITCNEQVSQQPQKEDTTMANNIFTMNMEFGPNKDQNIASTLMGIAVKNGDSWLIYDKKKKEITDVGDMQLGNLPIFILPTTQLNEGDLIKDAGDYYFVTKLATAETPTQTLSARTGEMKSVVPIKNVLGFNCYSKVIALSDSLNMGDDFDMEKLAIMSAMCSQNTGQMNQLLPLMLFKDKLGKDNDMMKLLFMSSMMTSEDGGDQMNQLLPLMLFKDKLGGDDDTMNLLLMSSLVGGNMAGSNNPLMIYLLLEAFNGKKDDKPLQAGNSSTK